MGKLTTVHPKNLMATREILDLAVLNSVLKFFEDASTKPPSIPIIAKKDDNLVVIDGHHLLAVCHYLDISCDVYLIDENEIPSWINIDNSKLNPPKLFPFDYVMNNNIDLF